MIGRYLCAVLSKTLRDNFAEVSVTIVDCPDLTAAPYGLARPGTHHDL